MNTLTIHTKPAYSIYIGSSLLRSETLVEVIHHIQANRVGIITDENTKRYAHIVSEQLTQHNITHHIFSINPGEQYKTRSTKAKLEDQMQACGLGRDTLLIGVGGGVITDLTGFIAATYCRGIPAIYIPTTLLAMLDASVCGKTGVNTPYGKNMIGAFKQPNAVLMDIDTLSTLPKPIYQSGIAEALKHALLTEGDLFNFLMKSPQLFFERDSSWLITLLTKSTQIKADIVCQDPKERGIRAILNLGHTFGHALETLSGYQLNHGQAVALGIRAEAWMACQLGVLPQKDLEKIEQLLERYQQPISLPTLDVEQAKSLMAYDKKAQCHQPRFVILNTIGSVQHQDQQYTYAVPSSLIESGLRYITQTVTQ